MTNHIINGLFKIMVKFNFGNYLFLINISIKWSICANNTLYVTVEHDVHD